MKINQIIKNFINSLNYQSLNTISEQVHYVIDNKMNTPDQLMLDIADEIFNQGFTDKWQKNQSTKFSQKQIKQLIKNSTILKKDNKKLDYSYYSRFRGQMMRALFLKPSYEVYKCLEDNGFFNTKINELYKENSQLILDKTQKDILQDDIFMMNIFLSNVDEEYQDTNWVGALKEENELKESERLLITNDLLPLFTNLVKVLDDNVKKTQDTYYKPSFFSPLISKMLDKFILETNVSSSEKQPSKKQARPLL